jgi:sarcosine oxidase subunit beta
MTQHYDVIIIGAGSIGAPTALALSKSKVRVVVVDAASSIGQGSNKAAIGGVRATHSNLAKVRLCLDSIQELSTWKERFGDEIEWYQGGYTFVAYDEETKKALKSIVAEQKPLNTGLQWLEKRDLLEHVPALSPKQLLGGTFAGHDGSASPLLTINAFFHHASSNGAVFRFNESVTNILTENHHVKGITTTRETYHAPIVINAAGASAKAIGEMTHSSLQVRPNVHEAGVTEPVQRFLEPMIVDTRKISNSSSIYFYQHSTGQIIFCLTPEPPIWERDRIETSYFLPLSARRLLSLVPGLRTVKVRRTWSGYYPMTPDGSPLLGWDQATEGMLIAAGMCGQGFMLGPGIGKLISRMIQQQLTEADHEILAQLSPYRKFVTTETLK